jgi:hypothetical protein
VSTHADKATALAEKVTSHAEDILRPLEWQMTKWPADFRAIMWGAVADIARNRQRDALNIHKQETRDA